MKILVRNMHACTKIQVPTNAYLDNALPSTGNFNSGFRLCACSWRCARNFLSANKKYVAVMWLYSLRSSALQPESRRIIYKLQPL
jgi:hypothetical protein